MAALAGLSGIDGRVPGSLELGAGFTNLWGRSPRSLLRSPSRCSPAPSPPGPRFLLPPSPPGTRCWERFSLLQRAGPEAAHGLRVHGLRQESFSADLSVFAGPDSSLRLLARLVGDVQTHVEEMERVRLPLLPAYPLLRGEGEGCGAPGRSSRSVAEGAGEKPGSQAQGKEPYRVSMDVSGFSPAELTVRLDGRKLTVTGKHEKKSESEAGVWSREYREIRRETLLPEAVDAQAVLCALSRDGQLRVEAPPLALPAAEGRTVPSSVCPGVKAGEGNVAPEGKEPGSSEMESGGESEGTGPRDS